MRKEWKEQGILVRFNVGLEDVADLIADIERAFAAM
jgi:cystathionine beta-lyase